MKEYGFNTTLLHGTEGNNPHGATQVPIYQSSAFRHDTAEELEKIFSNKMAGYSYTRIKNPTISDQFGYFLYPRCRTYGSTSKL